MTRDEALLIPVRLFLHDDSSSLFIEERVNAIYDHFEQRIKELEAENTKLKEPKTCLTCHLFEDNSCIHPEVEDFYVPQYINHSGCGLHELEEG